MKRWGVLLLLAAVISGILWWDGFSRFLRPEAATSPRAPRIVRIPPGMAFKDIARLLYREGLISSPASFLLLAWWKGVHHKIQWGDFELHPGTPPGELLRILSSGKTIIKKITIPEGFSLPQIASRLAEENVMEGKTFLASAYDPKVVQALGVDGPSLEGYLFPDTYFLHRGMTARVIQEKMVKRFREVYAALLKEAAPSTPPDLKKTVILASIIEKECRLPEERPLVASVFFNRLAKGMPLQSDPTVIYGLQDFNGDLTKKDLLTPTPYNTYLRSGLPPGPIANPGRDSLKAALKPARSDYLYFVSKNDGTHHFSKNLRDHQRAVARYQPPLKGEAKTVLR